MGEFYLWFRFRYTTSLAAMLQVLQRQSSYGFVTLLD